MDASRRILHVFRSPIGGLFRHVVDLAREQAARGFEVGIFCDSSTSNARTDAIFAEVASDLALGITRVPMRRNPDLRDLAVLRILGALQREIRADVLHGHGAKGGAYARILGDNARGGAVRAYTPHGGSFHFKPGNIHYHVYSGIERRLARRTDVFLFESRYVARCFEEVTGPPARPAFVVHNGLHAREFDPLVYEEKRFDLLYIGEMLIAKGVDCLLESLAVLRREQGRRLTLLAVGSGPDKLHLVSLAAEYGIGEQVTFEEAQPIRRALARTRLMVMPSRAESLPYVLLEAGAAGHPIVATNVGGIPEILEPVRDDLVMPGNATALALAIAARLGDSEKARRARTDAIIRHLRHDFSVDRMTDQVLEGYAAGLLSARR
ncbi:MAG TPA: glycosyltransferase family 4 protein [Saliniramus sp.]|nr:glycosyltransferase family 4 protein [Saliniramus sp.]